MPDLVDKIEKEMRDRLKELKPAAEEYVRLTEALERMEKTKPAKVKAKS